MEPLYMVQSFVTSLYGLQVSKVHTSVKPYTVGGKNLCETLYGLRPVILHDVYLSVNVMVSTL